MGRGLGMEVYGRACRSATEPSEEEMNLRRGPWTVEEDLILVNYIANHGEGRWNSLARCAGLKRTGKSCRLRWLNYLRPDVRRGNITPEEQLLILELHSRWGNRWSKIAQHLPGRTDNEIKNYWRTRVQKHAKQLRCDVNSKQFKDLMRYLWMPRLLERIRAASGSSVATFNDPTTTTTTTTTTGKSGQTGSEIESVNPCPENSGTVGFSSDSLGTQNSSCHVSDYYYSDCSALQGGEDKNGDGIPAAQVGNYGMETLPSPSGYFNQGLLDFDMSDNLWDAEDLWFLQQL